MYQGSSEEGPRSFPAVDAALRDLFGPDAALSTSYDIRALPVVRAEARRGGRSGATHGWILRAMLGGLALAGVGGAAIGFKAFEDQPARVTSVRKPVVAARRAAPVVAQPVAQLAIAPVPPVEIEPAASVDAPPRADAAAIEAASPPPAAKPVAREPVPARRGECARLEGAAETDCLAERLDEADQDLVDAYGAANDRGVSVAELRSLNRRWRRARDIARDDPALALTMYHRIAGELWAANPDD